LKNFLSKHPYEPTFFFFLLHIQHLTSGQDLTIEKWNPMKINSFLYLKRFILHQQRRSQSQKVEEVFLVMGKAYMLNPKISSGVTLLTPWVL
jgi:hypothetical protein